MEKETILQGYIPSHNILALGNFLMLCNLTGVCLLESTYPRPAILFFSVGTDNTPTLLLVYRRVPKVAGRAGNQVKQFPAHVRQESC